MFYELWHIALFSVGFNLLMYIPAFALRTDKLTDISYSLTFISIVLYVFLQQEFSLEKLVLTAMVVIWAVRLGAYLLMRIFSMGKDDRFDSMRSNFLSFLGFWLLQGVSVFIVSIPAVLFLTVDPVVFSGWSYLGILFWCAGLLTESLADWQKFRFKRLPEHKDNWRIGGLWRFVRYPNYSGEILLWAGIYLTCLSSLSTAEALVGLIGPVYIALLLRFVSGIPLLEARHEQKYGHSEAFRKYKKNTAALFPRGTRAFFLALAIPHTTGYLASLFTRESASSWYLALEKPNWHPPSWSFAWVWFLLYTLLGFATYLIWRRRKSDRISGAMILYGIQLFLNLLWSYVFFEEKNPGLGFAVLGCLSLLALFMLRSFNKLSRTAAWLTLPYVLWVCFAAYLNFTLWMGN